MFYIKWIGKGNILPKQKNYLKLLNLPFQEFWHRQQPPLMQR